MFKNLTPHEIVIFVGEEKLVVPASGEVLRLAEEVIDRGLTDEGIPIVSKIYSISELPPEIDGINYIVSGIVLPYIPQNRGDFSAPDTGNGSVVRDSDGRIIAVRRLISSQI